MKSRMLRNRCVIGLIVVALIAGCFQLKSNWWQPTEVRAQTDDDDDDGGNCCYAVLLLAVGSSKIMRVSVGTITTAPAPYSWSVVVRDQFNAVLFRSERIQVPAGEWRFSEISGAALGRTGDAPVMVQILVEDPGAGSPSQYIGSAQVVDVVTGESSTDSRITFTTGSMTKLAP